LDVGGGAAPYARAAHIIDILPYEADRLDANAWPASEEPKGWSESDYTCHDIVADIPWPFEDKQFELGVSSHCLEDLRDPVPAVREMCRVCKQVLIICPSRLFEQTRGVDHPLMCGLSHHPWMVYTDGNRLVFRRKTSLLQLPGAYLDCPAGKTLSVEAGSMFVYAESVEPEEQMFWFLEDDLKDYVDFLAPYRTRTDLFVDDGKMHGAKFWVRRFRQKWFGAL